MLSGMRALLLASLLFAAACGGTETCADGVPSLRITSPDEGDTVSPGRFRVDIEACGLELGENVRLLLLAPVEANYAFVRYMGEPELSTEEVPTLGTGDMRFVVTNMADDLRSEEITIHIGVE